MRYNITIMSIEALPSVVPAVTFDIGLGQTTEFIDFDYCAFDELARQSGMNDERITEATFQFKPLKNRAHSGQYHPKSHLSEVGVPEITEVYTTEFGPRFCVAAADLQGTPEQCVNDLTLHEIGHWVDDCTGDSKRLTRGVKIARAAVGIEAATMLGTGSFAIMEGSLTATEASLASLAVLIGSVMLSNSKYGEHDKRPWEKTAIEFKKNHQETKIVHFVPRIVPVLEEMTLEDTEAI